MKLIAILIGLALCGCETVTNKDGTTSTRFDGKAFNSAVTTSAQLYDRYYNPQPQPNPYGPTLYHNGQVIQPAY